MLTFLSATVKIFNMFIDAFSKYVLPYETPMARISISWVLASYMRANINATASSPPGSASIRILRGAFRLFFIKKYFYYFTNMIFRYYFIISKLYFAFKYFDYLNL